jgi:hypothetical protein
LAPITLHPENGHYFLFRGRPTVLISSAEHYGALLNLEFDFGPYLKELQAKGLNQTRAFSWAYREVAGSFQIAENTLAPLPHRFCAPWPRTETPGAADGLGKFDLSRWNDDYFRRLHDYCREAASRGVVIELVLFCPFYEEAMWDVSPMNVKNNVNGVGDVPRSEVYSLRHASLTAVQEALTRRLVAATRGFANLYYEVCNEPYFGGVTLEWQDRIIAAIVDAEKDSQAPHLIAQNIANGSAVIEKPNPHVSIFNFHYANPPAAVGANHGLNRVIAFDETGFKGTEDTPYRTDAWEFLLAGGGVYSHLDYSFTTAHENGTYKFPSTQPGGGGPALRRQLQILREFLDRFDLVRMRPAPAVIRAPLGSDTAWALVEAGRQYALYLKGGRTTTLTLDVPAGRYEAEWLHPRTGKAESPRKIEHSGGDLALPVPAYEQDIALRLVRRGAA